MSSIYCNSCKEIIQKDARICKNCGAYQTLFDKIFNLNSIAIAISLIAVTMSMLAYNRDYIEDKSLYLNKLDIEHEGNTTIVNFSIYNSGNVQNVLSSVYLGSSDDLTSGHSSISKPIKNIILKPKEYTILRLTYLEEDIYVHKKIGITYVSQGFFYQKSNLNYNYIKFQTSEFNL